MENGKYKIKKQRNRAAVVVFFAACVCSRAMDINVEWNATETATDGSPLESAISYKLFYGEAAGQFTDYVEVTNTQATVSGLEYNKSYYFSVKACLENAESDFSEELAWNSPVMADSDLDQISDDWELLHFGNLTQANSSTDSDGNGICDQIEFIAGTDPTNASDLPDLSMIAPTTISFETRAPEGSGYENRNRTYTLQYSENLSSGLWTAISGMENIAANGLMMTYELSDEFHKGFFRINIELN